MDAAHLHLMLNHFPLAGVLGSALILLFGIWRKNETLTRTGLTLVVLTGLLAIPTFLTGEPAEEVIEHLPGISESVIKAHEEAAEKVVWLVWGAAVLSLFGLIQAWRTTRTPRWVANAVVVLSLIAVASLAWVNNLGGKISHPEIRGAASVEKNEGEKGN